MKRITFVFAGMFAIALLSLSMASLSEKEDIKTVEVSKKNMPSLKVYE